VLRAIMLASLAALVMPPYAGVGQSDAATHIVIVSPPTRLAVPVGQAVEVRGRVAGAAASVELWSDDTLVTARPLHLESDFTFVWAPASPGTHCIRLRALGAEGLLLAEAGRCVAGLTRDSPVRVDAPR